MIGFLLIRFNEQFLFPGIEIMCVYRFGSMVMISVLIIFVVD